MFQIVMGDPVSGRESGCGPDQGSVDSMSNVHGTGASHWAWQPPSQPPEIPTQKPPLSDSTSSIMSPNRCWRSALGCHLVGPHGSREQLNTSEYFGEVTPSRDTAPSQLSPALWGFPHGGPQLAQGNEQLIKAAQRETRSRKDRWAPCEGSDQSQAWQAAAFGGTKTGVLQKSPDCA